MGNDSIPSRWIGYDWLALNPEPSMYGSQKLVNWKNSRYWAGRFLGCLYGLVCHRVCLLVFVFGLVCFGLFQFAVCFDFCCFGLVCLFVCKLFEF